MTLQDHFRELWRDCPAYAPIHVGVWLFDLVPDKFHTLGFFEDQKRETVSRTMDAINRHFKQQNLVQFRRNARPE